MSGRVRTTDIATEDLTADSGAEILRPLIDGGLRGSAERTTQTQDIVVGELIAIADEGRTPLVWYPGQRGRSAMPARSVVDLHGAHIGKALVLVFENGNRSRPLVMGVLRDGFENALREQPGSVEIAADGERMVVTAKEQLVLRCGKASITLTKAGKVVIKGSYVMSYSSGVNRVKGGSVQLN